MKTLVPLAASILGCAWLLLCATESPETLPDSIPQDFREEEADIKLLPDPMTDSIFNEKDSTGHLKVSVVLVD